MSADSLFTFGAEPSGATLFTYCRNYPIHYSDASGLASESCYDDGFDIDSPYLDAYGGGSDGGGSYTYASSVLNDIFPTGINSGYNTHINAESYSSVYSTAQNMLYSCDFVYDSVGASSFALKNGMCFSAGTLISGEAGLTAIECICVGDLVWAADPETGETALKRVLRLFRNETSEWVYLTVDGEKIVCTPGHKFYSPVKGWTAACQLRAGDILVTLNGEYVVLEKVQHELLENPEITYNFEVEGFHTYYVGGAEVLVHNACGNRTEVHHVVEQSQMKKSGFSNELIQSQSNKVTLDYDVHRKISGYYSSKQDFTGGLRVRDWLAGQSFEEQTQFGWNVIRMFGGE